MRPRAFSDDPYDPFVPLVPARRPEKQKKNKTEGNDSTKKKSTRKSAMFYKFCGTKKSYGKGYEVTGPEHFDAIHIKGGVRKNVRKYFVHGIMLSNLMTGTYFRPKYFILFFYKIFSDLSTHTHKALIFAAFVQDNTSNRHYIFVS